MRLGVLVAMLIIIEGVSAIGCSSARIHAPRLTPEESLSAVTAPPNWHKLEAVAFSLFAPSGWEFHQLQGVDSYVGEFMGDGVGLRFDFGGYASSCFNRSKKPALVIAQESIGGSVPTKTIPRAPGPGVPHTYNHPGSAPPGSRHVL